MRKGRQELAGKVQDSGPCKAGLPGTSVQVSAFSPVMKSFLTVESLLSALRDGKNSRPWESPLDFVFCSKHKTQSVESSAQVPRLGQRALHTVGYVSEVFPQTHSIGDTSACSGHMRCWAWWHDSSSAWRCF